MYKRFDEQKHQQEQDPSRYCEVEAHYIDPVLPSYQGNPLIEALPPSCTTEEIIRLLQYYPRYNEQNRRLPSELRLQLILNGVQFLQPLSNHIELAQLLSGMLRSGYVQRNPLTNETFHSKNQHRLKEGLSILFPPQPTVSSCTVIGISGSGKTAAVNAILALYDQIIHHKSYHGQPFILRQLTWMKLECPHDGLLRGLCKNFFKEVDRLMGTTTYQAYARNSSRSIDEMLTDMANTAAKYYLGVLVIDNIQILCEAKGDNSIHTLNFLRHLSNHVGIPVVLVGTPKALPILSGELFQARRISGQGTFPWDRMQEDEDWNLFTNALWRYQYLRQPIPLTEELRHALYDESQGIADLAIKVYKLAQIEAIKHSRAGEEEIMTESLLHSVAQNRLPLVQHLLRTLRTGEKGFEELKRYEYTAPIDLNKVVQEADEDLSQSLTDA